MLEDDETFTASSRNIEANALAAKSLTDHWSAAAVGAFQSSIFSNYDLRLRLGGGIEDKRLPLLRVDAHAF